MEGGLGDYASFFRVTAKWIMQGDEEILEPQSLDEELFEAFHRIRNPRYRRVVSVKYRTTYAA